MEAYQIAESLQLRGIEEFKRYYGVYNAIVANINDPEQRGRIQVLVPVMGHTNPISVWIEPSFLGVGTDRGFFWIPEVGDNVKVTFERGDSGVPFFYLSGFYGIDDLPEEFSYDADGTPKRKGFITRLGHKLIFSDEPGNEAVHLSCHFPETTDPALTDSSLSSDRSTGDIAYLDFSNNGVVLSNKTGSLISLDNKNKCITIIDENSNAISMDKNGVSIIDKNGQTIFMDGTSINITSKKDVTLNANTVNLNSGSVFLGKGATFSSVLGELLLTWLSTHVHAQTGPAPGSPALTGLPTTPPIVPAPPSLLSRSVKLPL